MQRTSAFRANKSEWGFVAAVAFLVLLTTSLPYVYAYISQPSDRVFVGFILNSSDHAQYLSWYRQFQTDHLISNMLTSEPNPPVFFNLLWWLLARFGRYTGLHYAVVYQLFRWLAGSMFFATVYAFLSQCFESRLLRRTTFLTISLGAGLGWLLVLLKYTLTRGELLFPLDVYIAEGNSLLCVMAYPHFTMAASLILAVFVLLLIGERRGQLRFAVFAGLTAQVLGWQHAYDLLIVWGVPGAYAVVRALRDRCLPRYWVQAVAIVGALSWPPALYSLLLTRLNPTWRDVLAQFANAGVYTPSIPHMFILAGLTLVLAVGTLLFRLVERQRSHQPTGLLDHQELYVVTWFVVGWALTYVPTDFQVHLINSWQIPVGILATAGTFRYFFPKLRKLLPESLTPRTLALGFIAVIIPTNLYLWSWRFYDLNRHDYPYYLHQDDMRALQWLDQRATSDNVVFSSYDVGRYVPSISHSRAFVGHWAQTIDFLTKRDVVSEFFASATLDARRKEILRYYSIDYVLHGPAERALGGYTPADARFLKLAFSAEHVQIYTVEGPLE
jgi:hypothetical protein